MGHVQRRGPGKWRARWRGPDGKEVSQAFTRRTDAEQRLATVKTDMSRGSYVDPKAGRVPTGVWAARWLEAQRHLKPSTRARYDGIVSKHIIPRWGAIPLAKITHADVAGWVASLDGAPASVRYVHRVLHLLLDLAVRDGRIASNPATGVRLPRAARPAKRALTHDDLNRLADAAGDSRTLVLLLGYVGLRWSEAAALRVGQVDLLRRRLTIAEAVTEVRGALVWGIPKSHAHRVVPLARFLVDDLAVLVAGKGANDLVFTTATGATVRNLNWRRDVFDPAVTSVGLDGLVPHELRHTAASLAIQSGASVKSVQLLLGHASATTTLDVYSHWFGDDLDRLADRLDTAAGEARAASAERGRSTVRQIGSAGV
ncbi:MAG: site-specific integrase [Actinomycetota bacterium]|nr:site-specific integrase [Actinomycetota bacterium]